MILLYSLHDTLYDNDLDDDDDQVQLESKVPRLQPILLDPQQDLLNPHLVQSDAFHVWFLKQTHGCFHINIVIITCSISATLPLPPLAIALAPLRAETGRQELLVLHEVAHIWF